MSLFDVSPLAEPKRALRGAPLAERMRPRTLEEYVGQEHLLGAGKPLRLAIERDDSTSMILWGPPGTGKTTLAKIIAQRTDASFVEFSAVMSGIKEIKQVMVEAEKAAGFGSRTILFVDEIHRFNKAQQDAFLPYVERGTIRLIGATTENPSFELNAALLSRCRVYTLVGLSETHVIELLARALEDRERGLGAREVAHDEGVSEALATIAAYASGDARNALNALEVAVQLAVSRGEKLNATLASEALQRRVLLYDKKGEQHYDVISALHKSVRNSDADAALYWLGRMLEAGEDPMYVARRVVRMAVEDIGLAAPEALNLCLSARDAMHFLGQPEGGLALAQAVVYLALAPKSNAVYTAYAAVQADIEKTAAEPVPLHLRNAPTRLMKQLDYGRDYQYAHDLEGRVAAMECLPASLAARRYYMPTGEGREKALGARMEEIRRLKLRATEGTNDKDANGSGG